MVVVFDLDDTLYDELSFVASGFKAVSAYLSGDFLIPEEKSFQFMEKKLSGGRGKIFDELLAEYGIYSEKKVKKCLSVYRSHNPEIKLYEEADVCLDRFCSLPIYIVTDGNKIVQHNKLEALNLNARVKYSYITHRFGVKNAKPSPYCFFKICEKEKVSPGEIVYIADNPNKDFVGIKPFGFKTARVLTGQYKNIEKPIEFEAEFRLDTLSKLTDEFLKTVFR